ncbi:MAG: hypothetical protein EOP83_18475 [Verrucomicrobiaceae bacterium]|nr:MAG: hypothetical protein EOP83_18475 [Verrucomicrobiaceae bacterium]
MDTIKIMLGMLVALLVGALAMSWKGFRQEVRDTPKKELAEVQRQIAEIEQQRKLLQEEKDRMMLGSPLAQKGPAEAPAIPEVAPHDVPETGAVFEEDAPSQEAVPEAPDQPAMPSAEDRAKAIAAAPVVGKITEWVEDPNLGAFATLEVIDAAAVKADAVLSVRRGTGLLGKLKVSEVAPEGALASPTAVFGEVKPKAGDELIVEPN